MNIIARWHVIDKPALEAERIHLQKAEQQPMFRHPRVPDTCMRDFKIKLIDIIIIQKTRQQKWYYNY